MRHARVLAALAFVLWSAAPASGQIISGTVPIQTGVTSICFGGDVGLSRSGAGVLRVDDCAASPAAATTYAAKFTTTGVGTLSGYTLASGEQIGVAATAGAITFTTSVVAKVASGAVFRADDGATQIDLLPNAQAIIFSAGVLQAALGTPSNGRVVYCSDCTIANPCAGGGTGAFAKRLNGAWVCN